MIIRKLDSARALCITQLQHSIMTGALADAWDKERYPAAGPFPIAARAALIHDIGWTDWEGNPENDPETGHPYDFLSMPKEAHLGIWRNGFSDAAQLDSFVGLLVLRHNMTLAGKDSITDPVLREKTERFFSELKEADRVIEQELLTGTAYGGKVSAEDIREMNRFVLLLDYISLRMCMGAERENPFGPPPEVTGQNFSMNPVRGGTETFELDPWPFTGKEFVWECRAWVHQKGEDFSSLPAESRKTLPLRLIPKGG